MSRKTKVLKVKLPILGVEISASRAPSEVHTARPTTTLPAIPLPACHVSKMSDPEAKERFGQKA